MDYNKIYNQLIERATRRELVGYKEQHHIIPKCVDITLSKEKSNLVFLTAKEHFVAHLLLCKIYPDNKKIWYAAWCMAVKLVNNTDRIYKVSSRQYAEIKSNLTVSSETRLKLSNLAKTRIRIAWTTEQKLRQKGKQLGIKKGPMTEVHKDNIRKAKTPMTQLHKDNITLALKGIPKSVEHREKIRQFNLGLKKHPHSSETKQKMSKPRTTTVNMKKPRLNTINMCKPKNKTVCPHCNKEGSVNLLKRWHFDNCKFKSNS